MSKVERFERLLRNARRRLAVAEAEVRKVQSEIEDLSARLEEARLADTQLTLPFEQSGRSLSAKWAAVLNFMLLRRPNPV
ncbi:MAG: hypothetical protein AB7F78_15570, partial [Hyphomicrobiaceae bacterium]